MTYPRTRRSTRTAPIAEVDEYGLDWALYRTGTPTRRQEKFATLLRNDERLRAGLAEMLRSSATRRYIKPNSRDGRGPAQKTVVSDHPAMHRLREAGYGAVKGKQITISGNTLVAIMCAVCLSKVTP